MSPRSTFTRSPLRAARWSAEHPWRAVGGWLLFVALAVGLAVLVPTQQAEDADYDQGESGRAAALVRDAGLEPPGNELVLVTAKDGGALPGDAEAAGAELAAGIARTEGVAEVGEPLVAEDGTALLLDVTLDEGTDDVEAMQDAVADVADRHPDLEVAQAGDVTLDEGIDERIGDDLRAAEGISVPVTLVLMLLAFGALIAAGIPVLIAATSVAATIGITAPLSHLVPAEATVSSMIVLIGMAVGVDYSLFYLKREREERAKGRSAVDAVEIAAQTSGHSIVVSGVAVVASMTGLYVVGGATFNSLATGAILVVAVAVLGSITVLPALLAGLGRWVDRPRVPLLWRANRHLNERYGQGWISRRVLAPALHRPVAALVVGAAVVVALAVPALDMKVHQANLQTLPASIPEVQTFRTVEEKFPSQHPTVSVVVEAAPGDGAAVARTLRELGERAAGGPWFADRPGEVSASDDGTVTVLRLPAAYPEADERVDTAIEVARDQLVPQAVRSLESAGVDVEEHAVGGGVAAGYDSAQHLGDRIPVVVGAVLLLTMLMMGFSFRSVPLALLSAVLNLASVAISFGMLTLVFQHGWFEGVLDFTSAGFVIDWLPLFVLVVLVGLSMDYHVFVLSRVREYVERGLPTRVAVERGIRDTAGVVTSAAAVMVSVFAIFATLSMLEMKMMGVGLAVTILVDATLVRLVLLPAALVLLGDRVWWPRRPQPPAGERVEEVDPGWRAEAPVSVG